MIIEFSIMNLDAEETGVLQLGHFPSVLFYSTPIWRFGHWRWSCRHGGVCCGCKKGQKNPACHAQEIDHWFEILFKALGPHQLFWFEQVKCHATHPLVASGRATWWKRLMLWMVSVLGFVIDLASTTKYNIYIPFLCQYCWSKSYIIYNNNLRHFLLRFSISLN